MGVGSCLVAALALAATGVSAHDIPNDVIVQAFLKPEGQRMRLLVRVPSASIADVVVPTRDRGYIDIARADEALRDGATVWIARNVRLYEEDIPLGEPRLVAVLASLPSDQSFRTYDSALAHTIGPRLGDDVQLVWEARPARRPARVSNHV